MADHEEIADAFRAAFDAAQITQRGADVQQICADIAARFGVTAEDVARIKAEDAAMRPV